MKKSVLLFALCLYIFAGCNKEPQGTPGEDECRVAVSFSADFIQSALKSTTEPEKGISKVILFGLDNGNNFAAKYTINSPVIGSQTQTMLKKIKTFYAVANPTAEMEALTPDKTALDALVGDFANAPATPLLMSGKGDMVVNSGNYSVAIQLVRSVAKVVFTSSEAGFAITSVAAKNTPNQGYVFSQGAVAVPVTAARVSTYATVAGTDANPVYVAESVNTDVSNTTTFTVTGTYDGKTATYGITLKTGGNNIPIERNKQYNVGVRPVTETTCEVTITIPDWTDVDGGNYEIPYEDFQ